MLRQSTELNFKWINMIKTMPSLLAVKEICPFRFYWLCCTHLQKHILGTVKHEDRPFHSTVNGFELMFLIAFAKRSILDVWTTPKLTKCFTILEYKYHSWHYQNITNILVFIIVFGIHRNFFIVLPIQLNICRSNILFPFLHVKMYVPKNQAHFRGFA